MKHIVVGLIIASTILAGCSEAKRTAMQELGPAALNKKYEWFKDAYARLDSLDAQIKQSSKKIKDLENSYVGVNRKDWARDDRESLNQWRSERDGIIGAYNYLAAEYNAEMSKWHTAFVNAGKLPEGGNRNMPRQVQSYHVD